LNTTLITVVTPLGLPVENLPVTVNIGKTPYTVNSEILSIENILSATNFTWLIVLLIVIGVVIIALIIIFIVIWRNRKQNDPIGDLVIELWRPDYPELLFEGNNDKYPEVGDNYEYFEELLLSDRNRIYITSIINSLQPTEHESATKCLVYMSYPSSQTLNIIMNALTYEISNSEKKYNI